MEGTYRTTDLGIASFLTARGHKLMEIGGTPGRASFTFKCSAELSADLLSWLNNAAVRVPARGLFNAMRDLRGAVSSAF